MYRSILGLFAMLALCSCATQPKLVWLRTDGQMPAANVAVAQQFEIASTVCMGERAKARMSGVQLCREGLDCLVQTIDRGLAADAVARGCMAQQGYLQVPEEQAAAKAAELRAAAAPARPLPPVPKQRPASMSR